MRVSTVKGVMAAGVALAVLVILWFALFSGNTPTPTREHSTSVPQPVAEVVMERPAQHAETAYEFSIPDIEPDGLQFAVELMGQGEQPVVSPVPGKAGFYRIESVNKQAQLILAAWTPDFRSATHRFGFEEDAQAEPVVLKLAPPTSLNVRLVSSGPIRRGHYVRLMAAPQSNPAISGDRVLVQYAAPLTFGAYDWPPVNGYTPPRPANNSGIFLSADKDTSIPLVMSDAQVGVRLFSGSGAASQPVTVKLTAGAQNSVTLNVDELLTGDRAATAEVHGLVKVRETKKPIYSALISNMSEDLYITAHSDEKGRFVLPAIALGEEQEFFVMPSDETDDEMLKKLPGRVPFSFTVPKDWDIDKPYVLPDWEIPLLSWVVLKVDKAELQKIMGENTAGYPVIVLESRTDEKAPWKVLGMPELTFLDEGPALGTTEPGRYRIAYYRAPWKVSVSPEAIVKEDDVKPHVLTELAPAVPPKDVKLRFVQDPGGYPMTQLDVALRPFPGASAYRQKTDAAGEISLDKCTVEELLLTVNEGPMAQQFDLDISKATDGVLELKIAGP